MPRAIVIQHHGEGRGGERREAVPDKPGARDDQDAEREARDIQRMLRAPESEFDQPRRNLRRPEQRADGDDGRGVNALAQKDRQHMRRKRRRDEHVEREATGDEQERQQERR